MLHQGNHWDVIFFDEDIGRDMWARGYAAHFRASVLANAEEAPGEELTWWRNLIVRRWGRARAGDYAAVD